MNSLHRGRQTVVFDRQPAILASAAIGGKKEAQGPLAHTFDQSSRDTSFGQPSWEKAESRMQQLALETALAKAGLSNDDLDLLFAGDLLNQCIGSGFALRDSRIPFLGLYGACSTMAEGLTLAAMSVNAGFARRAAAMTSSHFASAERQYRFPLNYGCQRPPYAQWTVTGAGCLILGEQADAPCVLASTVGTVVDMGIKDANNMGAAMAPAAVETVCTHLRDLDIAPEEYDFIVTGDLGKPGSEIFTDLMEQEGFSVKNHVDCGTMIYDLEAQDVHGGGSGCGCSAVVLAGLLLGRLRRRELQKILFCGTGAMLSPVSCQQGESIPAICHAVAIGRN